MTDSHLMGADCVHGVPWYECDQCTPMPLSEDEDIAARIADYLETHENFSGMTRREIALEAARLTLQAIREGWATMARGTTTELPRQGEATDQKGAARVLHVQERTLEAWRAAGKGPRYLKYPGAHGAVRYLLSDLQAFQAACTVDPGGGAS